MPYRKTSDLPPRVKHVLPKGAQNIFLKAFNNAFKQYGKDEVRAFRVAWGAVKNSYHKDLSGKWVKRKG